MKRDSHLPVNVSHLPSSLSSVNEHSSLSINVARLGILSQQFPRCVTPWRAHPARSALCIPVLGEERAWHAPGRPAVRSRELGAAPPACRPWTHSGSPPPWTCGYNAVAAPKEGSPHGPRRLHFVRGSGRFGGRPGKALRADDNSLSARLACAPSAMPPRGA
jgi:hypothetical protein